MYGCTNGLSLMVMPTDSPREWAIWAYPVDGPNVIRCYVTGTYADANRECVRIGRGIDADTAWMARSASAR